MVKWPFNPLKFQILCGGPAAREAKFWNYCPYKFLFLNALGGRSSVDLTISAFVNDVEMGKWALE